MLARSAWKQLDSVRLTGQGDLLKNLTTSWVVLLYPYSKNVYPIRVHNDCASSWPTLTALNPRLGFTLVASSWPHIDCIESSSRVHIEGWLIGANSTNPSQQILNALGLYTGTCDPRARLRATILQLKLQAASAWATKAQVPQRHDLTAPLVPS